MAPRSRFTHFEVVTVLSTPATTRLGVAGAVGAVLGISENTDGSHGYAVSLDGSDEVVDFQEDELASTGQKRAREEYYPGDVLRVDQRGRVVPDERRCR